MQWFMGGEGHMSLGGVGLSIRQLPAGSHVSVGIVCRSFPLLKNAVKSRPLLCLSTAHPAVGTLPYKAVRYTHTAHTMLL